MLLQEGLAAEGCWQQSTGNGAQVCTASGQSCSSPWFMGSILQGCCVASSRYRCAGIACTRGAAAAWILLMYGEQALLSHPKLSSHFQIPVQILPSVRH